MAGRCEGLRRALESSASCVGAGGQWAGLLHRRALGSHHAGEQSQGAGYLDIHPVADKAFQFKKF